MRCIREGNAVISVHDQYDAAVKIEFEKEIRSRCLATAKFVNYNYNRICESVK